MKEDVVEGMKDFLIEPVHLNLKSCFIYDTHCCGVIMNYLRMMMRMSRAVLKHQWITLI